MSQQVGKFDVDESNTPVLSIVGFFSYIFGGCNFLTLYTAGVDGTQSTTVLEPV